MSLNRIGQLHFDGPATPVILVTVDGKIVAVAIPPGVGSLVMNTTEDGVAPVIDGINRGSHGLMHIVGDEEITEALRVAALAEIRRKVGR